MTGVTALRPGLAHLKVHRSRGVPPPEDRNLPMSKRNAFFSGLANLVVAAIIPMAAGFAAVAQLGVA